MDGNRLGRETSPYLLQHKDNPVHWWGWCPEAFEEARRRDVPVLLSIGYAACHWCHVMAHESFEDPDIAGEMNRRFVNIKLDREERPDLDAIYQQALSMLGQHGGWPLTMFLSPDGEPFWGGTYFPPTPRYGRPGFPQVLDSVSEAWANERDKVAKNLSALKAALARQSHSPGPAELSLELLDRGAAGIPRYVDPVHGGLRGAPKFPQPGLFRFLWRAARRTGSEEMSQAVTLTLDHMCQGGIYDHLGGGFMRYSTDDTWLVPHFEKMLYDNAQLVELLTMVWRATGNPLYRTRVAETVEWVLREMIAEGGAFAATLDADSEGEEGRFYTWDEAQIDRLLEDADTRRWFKMAYDVRPMGNWEGRTILHRNHPDQPQGVEDLLADARAVLWRERESRVRPGRDDKVLADWNGMMIAALAEAAFTFAMPRWLDAALVAFEAVRTRMALPDHRLAHSMRFGQVATVGLLDDLAHMARAALALFEATAEPRFLDQARTWADAAFRHHWDEAGGGYFTSAEGASDVIVRAKQVFDNAVPAGNGVMAEVLARLALLTGEARYEDQARATVDAFSSLANDHFANMTALWDGFELLAAPVQVVVIGNNAEDDTAALLRAVAEAPAPAKALTRLGDGQTVPDHHPAHGKTRQLGKPTAYVCRGQTCSAPVTDPALLRQVLA